MGSSDNEPNKLTEHKIYLKRCGGGGVGGRGGCSDSVLSRKGMRVRCSDNKLNKNNNKRREGETDRQTERQTDSQTETETERERAMRYCDSKDFPLRDKQSLLTVNLTEKGVMLRDSDSELNGGGGRGRERVKKNGVGPDESASLMMTMFRGVRSFRFQVTGFAVHATHHFSA